MCIETSVDTALRIALVLLHLLTVSGGFMTGIGLGWSTRIFKEHCVLYSDMELSMSKNSTIVLDFEQTQWSSIHMCYYCTFSTGMASVYGIIWYWFYFLLSEWDKSNNSHFDWSAMIPIKTDSNRYSNCFMFSLFLPTTKHFSEEEFPYGITVNNSFCFKKSQNSCPGTFSGRVKCNHSAPLQNRS